MADIYIIFSSTPYRIGRLIRRFTAESYNHVSICTDRELTQMYSFARRFYRTALYGGFVKESLSRYYVNQKRTQVQICRVEISQEAYQALQDRLEEMYENRSHYLYNHLSVFSALYKRRILCRDAYTCVEFVAEALAQAGVCVDTYGYLTVGDLLKQLEHLTVYQGSLPVPTEEDRAYYAVRPVPCSLWATFRDFFALFGRL